MSKTKIYGYEMARMSEVYLSTLSSLMKPHGLERGFAPMIYLCEHSGQVTQNDLAHAMKIDKVAAMRKVDYLSKRDLVVRNQDHSDKRCHKLEVTPKGMALLPKLKTAIEQTNDILLEGFTEEEKLFFTKCMDKLNTTIYNLPEPKFVVKAFKRNPKS
ncbi:MAG: MarR family winged helix-turn-helix transcriptional regulator [Chitinophagales bacterium]